MNASVTFRRRKVNIRFTKSEFYFKKSIKSFNTHQIIDKSDFITDKDPARVPGPGCVSPPRAYLQEPVAGLADEGESHGSLGHGQLAASIPRRRPSELPQLLGDGEEQGHRHQAGGQRGQSRDQVERVEQHGDGEPGVSLLLWSSGWRSKTRSKVAQKKKKFYMNV